MDAAMTIDSGGRSSFDRGQVPRIEPRHRLSILVDTDRIIVLKEGHIVESGTHAELMRSDGYYTSLVKRQTRGLIQNDGEA